MLHPLYPEFQSSRDNIKLFTLTSLNLNHNDPTNVLTQSVSQSDSCVSVFDVPMGRCEKSAECRCSRCSDGDVIDEERCGMKLS